jgi:hypothetical protein
VAAAGRSWRGGRKPSWELKMHVSFVENEKGGQTEVLV